MLPPRRLTALLDQAVAYQVDQCVYHNTGDGPCQKTGWATDNSCSKETFPCETIQVLMDHGDKVRGLVLQVVTKRKVSQRY